MVDSHARSLVKSISWRVIAFFVTLVVVYAITEEATLSIKVAAIANLVKTILYYLHERIWNRLHWGRASIVSRDHT